MSEHRTRTVRIVTGRPWKDAVVSVLQPRSSLRPWSTPDECEPGDAVVAVVDTDPVSVFSGISVVGPDRDIHNAIAGNHHLSRAGLLELSTVNMLTDLAICRGERSTYRGREATKLEKFLPGLTLPTVDALFGHTSLAAARVLLHADGRCTACSHHIDLTGEAARDRIEVHTADPYAEKPGKRQTEVHDEATRFPADWPAVLCKSCQAKMRQKGLTSFLDFIFSLHPRCPQCRGQHSRLARYGLPLFPLAEPWIAMLGCLRIEPGAKWCCGDCGHQW